MEGKIYVIEKAKSFLKKLIYFLQNNICHTKDTKDKKNKKIIVLVLGLVFLAALATSSMFMNKKNHKSMPKVAVGAVLSKKQNNMQFNISEKLHSIAQSIDFIKNKLSSKNTVVNLDPIKNQLAQLVIKTQDLANKSDQLITKQITDSTQDLIARLNLIKKQLDQLRQQQAHVKYIGIKALPFQVVSIDNIQQINVVTLYYNHTNLPVTAGDYLAGWKLLSANFAKQKAEFVNKKQQHVIVKLNRIYADNRSKQA